MALLKAGAMRKNKVVTFPVCNYEGAVCCTLCQDTPVVIPMILVPDDTLPAEGKDDDVSFITYICSKHVDNLDEIHKEITRIKVLFPRNYQIMKASCLSDEGDPTDLLHPNVLQFFRSLFYIGQQILCLLFC
jgi:hypothetical protein